MKNGKSRIPVLLEDLAGGGKFCPPSGEVSYRCWRIDDPMIRRRLEGPRVVTLKPPGAVTAYFARRAASHEHFGGCCYQLVEVELCESSE